MVSQMKRRTTTPASADCAAVPPRAGALTTAPSMSPTLPATAPKKFRSSTMTPEGFWLGKDLTMDSPDEVLLHIGRFLDGESLTALSKVNKRFRGLCADRALWEAVYVNDFGPRCSLKTPLYRPVENLQEWLQPGERHSCWSECQGLSGHHHLSRSAVMFQPLPDVGGCDKRDRLASDPVRKPQARWLRAHVVRNNWLLDRKTNTNNNNLITCMGIVTAFDLKSHVALYGTIKGALGCYSTFDGSKLFYFDNVHSEAVWAAVLTDDGRYGFVGSGDKLISCWDIEQRTRIAYFFGHANVVRCLRIYKGDLFSVCSQQGISRTPIAGIVDPDMTNTNHRTWTLTVQGVRIVEVFDDLLFAGTAKGALSIYDMQNAAASELVATFHQHESKVLTIAYKSSQNLLATGGFDGQVVVYHVNKSGGHVVSAVHHQDPVTHLVFAEQEIISGSSKGKIHIQSFTGAILHKFSVHSAGITGLHLNPFGHLVSSSNDGTVVLADVKTRKLIRYLFRVHPEHNVWCTGVNDTQICLIYRNEHCRNQIGTIDYDWPNP